MRYAKSRIPNQTLKDIRNRRGGMPRKTTKKSSSSEPKIDTALLQRMYTKLVRIRELEEALKRAFIEHPGVLRGHAPLGDGEEDSIVGAPSTRRDAAFVMPSYRRHVYPI